MTTPDYEAMAIAQVVKDWNVSEQWVRIRLAAPQFYKAETAVIRSTMEAVRLRDELASVRKATIEREGLYVASRASVPERGQMWRKLRASGVKINASWIDEDGEGQTGDFTELWARIETEVKSSEALILYAEKDDFPLKGALIEVGMALSAGVPVFAVLPGIELEPRSRRPVGSWLAHPGVTIVPSVQAAIRALAEGGLQ